MNETTGNDISLPQMYLFWCSLIGVVMVIVILIAGVVAPKAITVHTIRIEPESVYMHNAGRYSYSVISDEGVLTNQRICQRNKVIVDPSIETSIYIESQKTRKQFLNNMELPITCELYISSVDYIKDSGWNYGKNGSGLTRRIE